MSGPNPSRQKSARATLESVFSNATNVWVIHYSCESFIDRPDGRSPRITSIAVRQLASGQTFSLSIHQVAEVQRVPFDRIEEHYDELEKRMLEAYFVHVSGHRGTPYLHWNMRDINYGFAAIEHRYRVLEGAPFAIPDDAKIDLSRLLIDLYGNAYIDHPRLPKLMARNHITALDLLSGAQEATAFDDRNFVALHRSTLRKVDVLANIAGRAHDRTLRTNTTYWERNGGRVRAAVTWAAANPTITLIASLASVAGLLLAVMTLH